MSEQKDTKVVEMPDDGIDFNQPLLDFNNKPIQTDDDGTPLRLGEAVCEALMAVVKGEEPSGKEKLKRFNLARKIQGGVEEEDYPTLRLKTDRKKMVLDLAAKVYSTLVYSRIVEAIEGDTDEEEE